MTAGREFIPESTNTPAALSIEAALTAAVLALRSYQYRNGAPDLAAAVADAGEAALRAAGGRGMNLIRALATWWRRWAICDACRASPSGRCDKCWWDIATW